MRIYGGARPATPDGVPTSVMLVQIILTKPCGTVAEKSTPANTPLHRLVHREPDGLFVRATWSDTITGAYSFVGVRADHKYFVTSFDYTGTYRAVIADNLTPVNAMSTLLALHVRHANARHAGSIVDLDSGTGNAAIQIYGGARPASSADAPGSVMLTQISLTKPCGTVSGGLLTLTPLGDGLITASGIATWGRAVNGSGEAAFDCDAGEGVGNWVIQLAQAELTAGGDARMVSAVLG